MTHRVRRHNCRRDETPRGANINVDLFTDDEHGVEAAADAVEAALQAAGFETEREDKAAGLSEIFEGMGLTDRDSHMLVAGLIA